MPVRSCRKRKSTSAHTHTSSLIGCLACYCTGSLSMGAHFFMLSANMYERTFARERNTRTHTHNTNYGQFIDSGRLAAESTARAAAAVLCFPSHTQPWGYCKILYFMCVGVELWYSKYHYSRSRCEQHTRPGHALPVLP